ncbi:TFIIH/NER complex subunit [Orbilia javanica]|uniref:RNA polymerase II transcription factor B subunit 3 n=1 Tax=Orbilia javanica TaxID=47235 RepID=A0AAN8RK83_9PEZI
MPSLPASTAAAIARARENAINRGGDADEICPVCKSSRYLNPNMRFLVNPECYHKMCESCVDRLFSQGPSQCPVVGCDKILRKQRFRKQTFEDIQVEKEVDVRKRIAKTLVTPSGSSTCCEGAIADGCAMDSFNKRQEDFPSLKEFNDYLEEVETVTFNLLNSVDINATEAKITAFEQSNKSSILQNAAKAAQEQQFALAQREFEKEHHRRTRELENEIEAEEKREKAEHKANLLKALEAENPDAEVAKVNKLARKKSSMRREHQERRARELEAAKNAPAFQFMANLNRVAEEPPQEKYDPVDGFDETTRYFMYRDRYESPWLDDTRNNKTVLAGGYLLQQYYERAVFEAFSGVGCFIEDPAAEGQDAAAPLNSFDTPMIDTI